MLSERKKKVIMLTLVLISFVLNIMIILPYDPLSMFWYKVGLYYWSGVPAFVLPSAAIVITLRWKPGNRLLRGLALFFSIMIFPFMHDFTFYPLGECICFPKH